MKKFITTASLSAALVLSACANDDENKDEAKEEKDDIKYEDTLATSDAGDVTVDDILNSIGSEEVASQTFELTLNKIIEDKYKDEVDIDQLKEDIDKEIEEYGGEEQFSQVLAQSQPGLTVEGYKQSKNANVLHNKFFADKLEISDDDALKDSYNAQHILVKVEEEDEDKENDKDAKSDKEAKKEAEDILKEVKDGGDFDEIAKEKSDDTGSSMNGGKLGLVTKGQMVPEFEEALFELEPGEISDVVKSDFGYHIIKRLDTNKEDMSENEIADAKSQIINQKIQEDPNKIMDFYKELLDEYNVKFKNKDIEEQIDKMMQPLEIQQDAE